MERRIGQLVAGMTAGLVAPSWVMAQPVTPVHPGVQQPSAAGQPGFVKVDQTVDDVSLLGTSMRTLSIDLRVPTGFRDVYRIQGSGKYAKRLGVSNPSGGDLFARVDGAVTAVFPQSVYVPTQDGVMAAVPPGTVFFIGPLPMDLTAGAASGSPLALNTMMSTRVEDMAPQPFSTLVPISHPGEKTPDQTQVQQAPPKTDSLSVVSLMTDEEFRQQTVRNLIERAAAIALGAGGETAAKP